MRDERKKKGRKEGEIDYGGREGAKCKIHTACPRLKGWISRKASKRSFSKSLNEGISPAGIV